MKKFVAISVLLHFFIFFLIFFKWEAKPRLEWGGGETAVISVFVPGTDLSFPRKRESRPILIPQNLDSRFRGNDNARGHGTGVNNGTGSGYDNSNQISDNVLAQIRLRIERAKLYPLLAKRQGIHGTSTVSFAIGSDGKVKGVSLTGSSGSALLDEEAVATIKRAQPYPLYDGPITLGLKFDLEE